MSYNSFRLVLQTDLQTNLYYGHLHPHILYFQRLSFICLPLKCKKLNCPKGKKKPSGQFCYASKTSLKPINHADCRMQELFQRCRFLQEQKQLPVYCQPLIAAPELLKTIPMQSIQ